MKNLFLMILKLAKSGWYGDTIIKWQAGKIVHVDNKKSEDIAPFKTTPEEISELEEKLS